MPVGSNVFWAGERQLMYDVIISDVEAAATASAFTAAEAIQLAELGIDLALVNDLAVLWARQYTFELVGGLTNTTMTLLQEKAQQWIASGQPLHGLALALQEDAGFLSMFDPARARMVAITETTRIFAEVNVATWAASGVVQGTTWNDVRDENVDPICEANVLAGVVPLGESYPSGDQYAPAHPGCRCYMQPEVKK